MKPLFDGLVVISGRGDAGKTSLALGCGPSTEKIVFVDADIKGTNIASQFAEQGKHFGQFHDLVHETRTMREIEYHDHCMKLIESIPDGQFEAVIWDTWTQFESTFQPYVTRYQSKFRESWSPKGDIHGAQIWQSSFDYETQIIDKLLHKANMLILTTILKDESINGKKTGKQIPDVKRPLVQKANMRLFVMHDPQYPEPIALVLKRIAKYEDAGYGIKTTAVLPRKIRRCTWQKIRDYWEHPVGDRKLEDDEVPNEYDISLLDGTLTDENKMILQLQPVFEQEEETPFAQAQDLEHDPETIAKVKEMTEAKVNPKVIADSFGLKVSTVLRMQKA